jgi:hypothetical protein
VNAINLDDLYLPEDVDEDMKQDFIEILQKIPDGWGRWITCDKGWYKLVIDTHKKLKYIDPDYEIHQIKEKFGGLRYYYHCSVPYKSIQREIMDAIIWAAELNAEITCETCGSNSYKDKVKMRVRRHWYKTLCIKCAKEQDYSIDEEEDE